MPLDPARAIPRPKTAGCASARRTAAIMAAIVCSAVLARLPFLSNVGVDESFYLAVARQWLEGLPPYAGSFDVKPPLLFALMAMAEAAFGPNLLAAKALSMAAVASTSCALYLSGKRFLGELAGVAAALYYVFSTLTLGGTFSPAELFMAPFTAFAMLLALPAVLSPDNTRMWPVFIAGIGVGAAACVKQTAVFEAIPLAIFLLFGRPAGKGLRNLGVLAAGCAIAPAAFCLLFFVQGHLGPLIEDAVISGVRRAAASYVPWSEALVRLLIELMLILPLAIPAAAILGMRPALRRRPAYRISGFLGAWAGAALVAVFLTRAMCDFYMLAAVPPLCLLAGIFVDQGLAFVRGGGRRFAARFALIICTLLFFAQD
jgi:4-amino-4-deoxy-L-arabinose transferase-like glycosyltransferase